MSYLKSVQMLLNFFQELSAEHRAVHETKGRLQKDVWLINNRLTSQLNYAKGCWHRADSHCSMPICNDGAWKQKTPTKIIQAKKRETKLKMLFGCMVPCCPSMYWSKALSN